MLTRRLHPGKSRAPHGAGCLFPSPPPPPPAHSFGPSAPGAARGGAQRPFPPRHFSAKGGDPLLSFEVSGQRVEVNVCSSGPGGAKPNL